MTVAASKRENPWAYRHLILNFARRDMAARYNATALGWVWALLGPLATIAIYSVVFSFVLRVTPPPMGNGDPGIYAVFLISGLVTWNYINRSLTSGMPGLLGTGAILQKVYLPSFVPVLAAGVTVAVQALIELGIVLLILIAFLNVSWTWLLLPVWLALLVAFCQSVSYVLALANIYSRDLQQIMTLVMQLLFFLSPVIYPLSLVPESIGPVPVRTLVELNPIGLFITTGRDLMYSLTVPGVGATVYLLG